MCGLMVWRLEAIKEHMDQEMADAKAKIDEKKAKRGALGRTMKAEMPVKILEAFETYLEQNPCEKDSMMYNVPCKDQNGIDDSQLRNPLGMPYDREQCKARVQEMCTHMRDEYTDDLFEAAYNGLTASECEQFVPQCTRKRARMLLGPRYGKEKHRYSQLSAGVRDVWQKMPGMPPYYFNPARHISQVEMPKGWDENGPREQVLHTLDEDEEEENKDEL